MAVPHLTRQSAPRELAELPGRMITGTAAKALAVLRLTLGAVFLWAFADKTFGLAYTTPSERAWIHGGSPTNGFLSHVEAGPFQGLFRDIAGAGWADALFMLGLLAIGVALVAGVAMRIAAVSGVAMMAMMWAAEWPPAQTDSLGQATGSSNPLVDYHFVYAVALIVLAAAYAGHTWGLGAVWARIPFVGKHRWLI